MTHLDAASHSVDTNTPINKSPRKGKHRAFMVSTASFPSYHTEAYCLPEASSLTKARGGIWSLPHWPVAFVYLGLQSSKLCLPVWKTGVPAFLLSLSQRVHSAASRGCRKRIQCSISRWNCSCSGHYPQIFGQQHIKLEMASSKGKLRLLLLFSRPKVIFYCCSSLFLQPGLRVSWLSQCALPFNTAD